MTTASTTASHGTRLLGALALALSGLLALLGLVVSPDDEVQGASVRLLYIHVGAISAAYVGFGLCAFGSAMFLWRKAHSMSWDYMAGSCGEVGLLFLGINLLSGSLWGKHTWGVYWTWDARLTSTALLFLLFLGYLAVRRLDSDPGARAKRSAIVALVAVIDIPIVNQSVTWWRSLHQGSTFQRADVQMDGLMLFTTFLGVLAFLTVFAWLSLHRSRTLRLIDLCESTGLDAAIEARMAEGTSV